MCWRPEDHWLCRHLLTFFLPFLCIIQFCFWIQTQACGPLITKNQCARKQTVRMSVRFNVNGLHIHVIQNIFRLVDKFQFHNYRQEKANQHFPDRRAIPLWWKGKPFDWPVIRPLHHELSSTVSQKQKPATSKAKNLITHNIVDAETNMLAQTDVQ